MKLSKILNNLFRAQKVEAPKQDLRNAVVPPGVVVEHREPVMAAAESAIQQASLSVEQADREIERLTSIRDELLPVEQGATVELQMRISELQTAKIDAMFPRLDLSFLKWRRKDDGWPVFALYTSQSNACQFAVHYNGGGAHFYYESEPHIGIREPFFSDVIAKLRSMACIDKGDQCIRSTFKGLLPDKARASLKKAEQSRLFEHVVIVGEATWEHLKIIPGVDPLIVGLVSKFDYKTETQTYHGWLIDKFDVTAVERIIAAEFSSDIPSGAGEY